MHDLMGAELAQERGRQFRRESEASRSAAIARGRRPVEPGVLLRSLTRADADHMAELFERLSPRSRYLRFFAPIRRLSPRTLRALADIDHQQREAVGAFDSGVLVGAARYVRNADEPTSAEIAVEVADDYQRRGIGVRLIQELARRGRERGITHFVATSLSENSAVMGLVHQSPWPAVVSRCGRELSIALTFPDATAT